jgi:hypothetical protein
MHPKKAAKLQRHLEKVIIEAICKLGLKNLPLLPAHATVKEMAKAAVAVYERAVDEPDDGTTSEEASNGL